MLSRVLLVAFVTCWAAMAVEWRPVPPELLQQKEPRLDKNAGAEAIFWEAWVEDTVQGNYGNHVVSNYIRIKLYNQQGVQKHGDVEIPYFTSLHMSITNIRGRTIKPDGTIVELKKDAIFDTVQAKAGKKKYKRISFALPAMEPGAVIEYMWTEVFTETLLDYVRLPFQREIPVWEVNYFVRPLSDPRFPYQMRAYPFNCKPEPWTPVERGFVKTSLKDVPAFVEEPRMPAEDDVRAWMLLYYTDDKQESPKKYWNSLGKKLHEEFKREVKVSDAIRKKAAELTGEGPTPEIKLGLLAEFCRSKIKNVSYRTNNVTAEDRDNFKKPNQNSNDTLQNGIGTPHDINILFAALAQAAGFEPRLVRAGSANEARMRPDMLNRYLLKNQMIAVKIGEKFVYYNPGVPYVSLGMLDWDEEGQPAVIAHDKEPAVVTLPFSEPARSNGFRRAELKLAADGTVSGKVVEYYHGQQAVAKKRHYEDMSPAERTEELEEELRRRYSGAAITELAVENADAPAGPVKISYTIRAPGMAEKTGKRLFLTTEFFQIGTGVPFPNADRKYPISFRYPFREDDSVSIEYPEGFALESPESPGELTLGEVGAYHYRIRHAADKRLVLVERGLLWGTGGRIYFDAAAYGPLRNVWNLIHERDAYTMTFKQVQ